MTEPDTGSHPAARHNDTGQYIDHRTGQPFADEHVFPEPVAGAAPWTNDDVVAMSEGRQPTIAQPGTADADPVADETPSDGVPTAHDLDTGLMPSNVTPNGVNHFGVHREGEDTTTCGGCGQEWPCSDATQLAVGHAQQHASGEQADNLVAAAGLLGMAPFELRGKLAP